MKKLISLFLAVLVTLSISIIPVFAAINTQGVNSFDDALTLSRNKSGIYEITNSNARSGIRVYPDEGGEIYTDANNGTYMRIDATRFFKAEKLVLATTNSTEFSALADEYAFSPQLIADVTLFLNKVNSGDIHLLEPLAIYVPERNVQNSNARLTITDYSNRTYTGYNNRQYYEEIIKISAISNDFNVRNLEPGWASYLNKVFSASVVSSMDGLMNSITNGWWTLVSVLGQSVSNSIPTTNAAYHTAKLIENKYIKYTSLYQGTEMYLGSVTEYAYQFRYQNFLNYDGVGSTCSGYTNWYSAMATGYNNADEYAYRYYLNTYHNPITQYLYKSNDGEICVYVDSLY